jgi:hypothetical protein
MMTVMMNRFPLRWCLVKVFGQQWLAAATRHLHRIGGGSVAGCWMGRRVLWYVDVVVVVPQLDVVVVVVVVPLRPYGARFVLLRHAQRNHSHPNLLHLHCPA